MKDGIQNFSQKELKKTVDKQRLFALSQCVEEEFTNLLTKEDKRKFVENIRYLIMSENSDFENYYFNQKLKKSDFYTVVNLLFKLDNLWMLSEFLLKNQSIIVSDTEKIINPSELIEITGTGRMDMDVMVTRVFKMMQNIGIPRRNETND